MSRLDAPGPWRARPARPRAVSRIWTFVEAVYDNVHTALWATLCAFVLYGIAFVLPSLPAMRANMEQQRQAEIAAESRHYCEKWGMPAGSPRHMLCVLDLQKIRTNVEHRLAPDNF